MGKSIRKKSGEKDRATAEKTSGELNKVSVISLNVMNYGRSALLFQLMRIVIPFCLTFALSFQPNCNQTDEEKSRSSRVENKLKLK